MKTSNLDYPDEKTVEQIDLLLAIEDEYETDGTSVGNGKYEDEYVDTTNGKIKKAGATVNVVAAANSAISTPL